MRDTEKPIVDVRTTTRGNQPPVIGRPQSQSPQSQSPQEQTQSQSPQEQTQSSGIPAYRAPAGSSSSSAAADVTSGGSISTSVPDEFKGSSNQELIDYLERKIREHKPLSDADLAKIRRRQKAEGMISGISDAVMSIANLIATHNYAPNMYDPKGGMSAKAKERFEKEKADREAEDDRYFNYAITLGRLRDADKERGLQAWQMEQSLARQDRAFDLKRNESDATVAKLNALAGEAMKRGDAAEADKLLKEAQRVKTENEAKWVAAVKGSEASRNRAAAAASYARAAASDAGVASKGMHFDGKTYYSKEDYEKAVYRAAREYNTRHKKVKKDDKGNVKTDINGNVEYEPFPVPTEWDETTAYGIKPHLYSASDVAASLEPLLEQERRNNRVAAQGNKTNKGSGGNKGVNTPRGENTKKLGL